MHVPIDIGDGMIHNLMRVFSSESAVGKQGVTVQRRSYLDVLANFRLNRLFLAVRNYLGAHFAASFKNAHDWNLVMTTSAGDTALTLRDVHVACFTADEGFIDFDVARKHLVERSLMKSKTNPVGQVPCGLLPDAEMPRDLATT